MPKSCNHIEVSVELNATESSCTHYSVAECIMTEFKPQTGSPTYSAGLKLSLESSQPAPYGSPPKKVAGPI